LSFFKKIDKLIAKSFVAPYVLSFVIAEFVLVMQFLWQKIDDILGKGVSAFEISGLIGYFSVVIMPRAIPITILLSSVFVYGNMAERYELTSMKSAGLSFTRILRSGFTLAVLTAIFSLLASNIFAPKAHYLFQKKFNAIKKQKAALLLESGQFNKDFSGFTIYVGDKDKTGRNIEEVLMYDENFTDPSLVNMVSAKSGVMEPTEDGRFFRMLLRDGVQYRDLKESRKGKDNKKSEKYPFVRTKFKEWEKIFDMTQFDIDDSNSLSTNKEDLMHSFQLLHLKLKKSILRLPCQKVKNQ